MHCCHPKQQALFYHLIGGGGCVKFVQKWCRGEVLIHRLLDWKRRSRKCYGKYLFKDNLNSKKFAIIFIATQTASFLTLLTLLSRFYCNELHVTISADNDNVPSLVCWLVRVLLLCVSPSKLIRFIVTVR